MGGMTIINLDADADFYLLTFAILVKINEFMNLFK